MQTLFNKRKKLLKQNDHLFKSFLANIILIIVTTSFSIGKLGFKFLITNLFPFITMPMILGISGLIVISEIIIIKNFAKNHKIINEIEEELNYLASNKRTSLSNENVEIVVDTYFLENRLSESNDYSKTKKKVLIRKKD